LICTIIRRGGGRVRRLQGKHAYAAVFAFKCRVAGRQLHIYGRPNGISDARLGVIVGKRLMPRAVDRNYCKRLVREMFRRECGALKGFDFVVRLQSGALPRPQTVRVELRELLSGLLRKCGDREPVVDHG